MAALEEKSRFDLPDDWTPEGLVCVTFPCPDDPQYTSMLAGLVDMLKFSQNFQRDPTGQGAATVSRTWQSALESQPYSIRFIEDCGEMPYLLRQNPDNPCQLQQSQDDGETWTLAYDHSLCQPVSAGVPPNDVDDTLAKIPEIEKDIIDIIIDNIGLPPEQIEALVLDAIQAYDPSYDDTEAIHEAVQQALDEPSLEDYADICVYREQYDMLWKRSMESATPDEFVGGIAERMIEIAEHIAQDMIRLLNGMLSGMSRGAFEGIFSNRTPGDGSAYMNLCPWKQTLDFEVRKYGFNPSLEGAEFGCPLGIWTEGVGWTVPSGCTTPPNVALAISRLIPAYAEVTRIEFEPIFTPPSASEAYGIQVNADPDCVEVCSSGGCVYLVADFADCPDVALVRLAAYNGNDAAIVIPVMLMEGIGHNPFAS